MIKVNFELILACYSFKITFLVLKYHQLSLIYFICVEAVYVVSTKTFLDKKQQHQRKINLLRLLYCTKLEILFIYSFVDR